VPQPDRSTEEIIRDLKRGGDWERDFRILFERYYGQVHRFFQRKGIPLEDCPDLTQEVFFSVYNGLRDIRQESQFQNWLFTLARNVFVNALERKHAKKRDAAEVSLNEELSESEDLTLADSLPGDSREIPIEAMLETEKLDKLRGALKELPEQMRHCVQLRVLKDLAYQEIADLMGISINTVKAHLFKARESLKEKLRPYFGDLEMVSGGKDG
jgi:RNA polymerase sigma-70 factor (ECF subfamily)